MGWRVLPPHEVFPLYSGYADGFWAGQGSTWDDSFRDHFRFTHIWDDPGVGGDFREEGVEIVVRDVDPEFPPATCELGGGMATAYHRRPIDAAARHRGAGERQDRKRLGLAGLLHVRRRARTPPITCRRRTPRATRTTCRGSTTTSRRVRRDRASGAEPRLLRDHNAFLAAFGDRLVQMYSSLPDDAPVDVQRPDIAPVGGAQRRDVGFLFINTHEPHEPLAGADAVQFRVHLGEEDVDVPDAPIDIPSGLVARWPCAPGRCRRRGSTGRRRPSPASSTETIPTLVLRAQTGVAARIEFGAGTFVSADGRAHTAHRCSGAFARSSLVLNGALRVMTVVEAQADRLWYLGDQLVDAEGAVWIEDGRLVTRSGPAPGHPMDGESFQAVAMQAKTTADDVGRAGHRAAGCGRAA